MTPLKPSTWTTLSLPYILTLPFFSIWISFSLLFSFFLLYYSICTSEGLFSLVVNNLASFFFATFLWIFSWISSTWHKLFVDCKRDPSSWSARRMWMLFLVSLLPDYFWPKEYLDFYHSHGHLFYCLTTFSILLLFGSVAKCRYLWPHVVWLLNF